MLSDRKPALGTNVFVYDEEGRKHRFSPADVGAARQERLGSHIQGLGLPQPTQFIVVPKELLTADEVVEDMISERRTVDWKLRVVYRKLLVALGRAVGALDRVASQVRFELATLWARLLVTVNPVEVDDSWGSEVTEIVERPPKLPKLRRPSAILIEAVAVIRSRAPVRARLGTGG